MAMHQAEFSEYSPRGPPATPGLRAQRKDPPRAGAAGRTSSLSDSAFHQLGFQAPYNVPIACNWGDLAIELLPTCWTANGTLFIPIYRATGAPRPPFRWGRGRTFASGSTPWSPDSIRRALSPARAVKIDGIRART